jgi:hypothetical protein
MSFSMPYTNSYIYQGCEITINEERKESIFEQVHFHLRRQPEEYCNVTLTALWKTNIKFSPGEYYQEVIDSHPICSGLGGIMHDFFIDYRTKLDFKVESIYSTNPQEDNHEISEAALIFWKNRSLINKAIFNGTLDRYSIIWTP